MHTFFQLAISSFNITGSHLSRLRHYGEFKAWTTVFARIVSVQHIAASHFRDRVLGADGSLSLLTVLTVLSDKLSSSNRMCNRFQQSFLLGTTHPSPRFRVWHQALIRGIILSTETVT